MKEARIGRLETALRDIQMMAGHELTQLTSNHPYYRIFESFHRAAAGALSSGEVPVNQESSLARAVRGMRDKPIRLRDK